MAAKSIEEEKPFLSGMGGGSTNLPVNIACFELIKPSFDETNHHCSLDVLPILIEETSFPVREKCSLNTSHGQDVYSISVLPEEGNTSPKCTPQLTFLSLLEVPFPSENQMCLDAKLSCHNCINLKVDSEDAYSSCILDINIEKELPDILTSSDEIVGNSKTEGVLTNLQKVLQRQSSLYVEKSLTERVQEAPMNRWKRYKRAASFDSRKIFFLFSILSCLGTLILIYLTLRVTANY
ncbi:Adenine deaminase 2 [Gossypium arboreum]|uniref:Adenine deaminase 2 n=3 Tax=Gossypium TaxID=3633 RepID=A0A0B0PKM7_GOSAR|nr:uncharacterized protein LOC108487623 isoform X1 [Gossypium arboreum]XP_040934718.1 uncharacterized protein LOC121208238 [Gossypium hirsutum]TYJ14102.1 hypothetical protein E1A91_A10G094700v1 [Gossypium mustelinum]KAG4179107.1 hypothetical protein ERO13_A10G085300v2 [Gossypium hirsutum]KHG10186.1 Adenine deaminase 2 [Gossypium arboreum]KHG24979.1 Adenine deaminase 2 [Gossypium arboreum]